MWKIHCILIAQIFQLILLINLFPVSFGVGTIKGAIKSTLLKQAVVL